MQTAEENMIIKWNMKSYRLDWSQNLSDLVAMHMVRKPSNRHRRKDWSFYIFLLRGKKEQETRFQDVEEVLCRLLKEKYTYTNPVTKPLIYNAVLSFKICYGNGGTKLAEVVSQSLG